MVATVGLAIFLIGLAAYDPGLLRLWFAFALFALIPSALIAPLGRKRARWRLWELAYFVCPYVAWALFVANAFPGKTLSNLALEGSIITILIPAALLVRVISGHEARLLPPFLFLGTCLAPLVVAALVPPLPE